MCYPCVYSYLEFQPPCIQGGRAWRGYSRWCQCSSWTKNMQISCVFIFLTYSTHTHTHLLWMGPLKVGSYCVGSPERQKWSFIIDVTATLVLQPQTRDRVSATWTPNPGVCNLCDNKRGSVSVLWTYIPSIREPFYFIIFSAERKGRYGDENNDGMNYVAMVLGSCFVLVICEKTKSNFLPFSFSLLTHPPHPCNLSDIPLLSSWFAT